MEQDRIDCLNRILESTADHKIIVSGPGTGKTYTFKRLLQHDPGESLVITLINNLINEMQDDLGSLAEVRTFHSLARKLLHRNPYGGITSNFHFYPNLYKIISDDSFIFNNLGIIDSAFSIDDFGKSFRTLNDINGILDFFIHRANYYDAVSFDDSVYRVLSLFQQSSSTIPIYHHIMVDEFQDFNALEVSVIELLEGMNRMLIVGDDDQSIYDFRQASPQYLREKISDERYVRYPLPYCTRCTSVIISSVESVIISAQSIGNLSERLDKQFICYLPEKQTDNENYPLIKLATCSVHRKNAPYISRYIESVISDINPDEYELANRENYPIALVVGPGHYLDQIYAYLHERIPNVVYNPRPKSRISLIDGFKLLVDREDSNLGWRIISELLLPDIHIDLVGNSRNNQTPYPNLLDADFKEAQLHILGILNNSFSDPDLISQEEKHELESYFNEHFEDILKMFSVNIEPEGGETTSEEDQDEYNLPSVLLTNYNGSKGLSAGFTFIVGFEEGLFPSDNRSPSFTEICQLIVALTRTRQQCHLIHTRNFAGKKTRRSVFLDWLDGNLLDQIYVDKNYF